MKMQSSGGLRREKAQARSAVIASAQRSNPPLHLRRYGLLRCARNDGERPASLSPSPWGCRRFRRMGRAKRNPSPSAPALMGIASLHPSYGIGIAAHPSLSILR